MFRDRESFRLTFAGYSMITLTTVVVSQSENWISKERSVIISGHFLQLKWIACLLSLDSLTVLPL